MTLAVFYQESHRYVSFPLLDSKQLEDTIHLSHLYALRSDSSNTMNLVNILWTFYKYEFFLLDGGKQLWEKGQIKMCMFLSSRMSPRDLTENLYSQRCHRSNAHPWSTAHKPHTPGWDADCFTLRTHSANKTQCLQNARTDQSEPVYHGWNSEQLARASDSGNISCAYPAQEVLLHNDRDKSLQELRVRTYLSLSSHPVCREM